MFNEKLAVMALGEVRVDFVVRLVPVAPCDQPEKLYKNEEGAALNVNPVPWGA
jgi:hypothetical protein